METTGAKGKEKEKEGDEKGVQDEKRKGREKKDGVGT